MLSLALLRWEWRWGKDTGVRPVRSSFSHLGETVSGDVGKWSDSGGVLKIGLMWPYWCFKCTVKEKEKKGEERGRRGVWSKHLERRTYQWRGLCKQKIVLSLLLNWGNSMSGDGVGEENMTCLRRWNKTRVGSTGWKPAVLDEAGDKRREQSGRVMWCNLIFTWRVMGSFWNVLSGRWKGSDLHFTERPLDCSVKSELRWE